MSTPAILALEDGSIFEGISIGHSETAVGEVVFNTSMTGYQEILTDPSYARQLVTLTYPHIGNTGCNSEDNECQQVWASGLIIRDLPLLASNFRSEQSLSDFLIEKKVTAIAEIDTRRLARLIRQQGALKGCLTTNNQLSAEQAIAQAQAFSGLQGLDLASEVSTSESYSWSEGSWRLGQGFQSVSEKPYRVVAYDFGVKRNILRLLADRGCDITVVPANTPADQVLALKPDGVFLSNGPGDPEACHEAISSVKQLLDVNMPLFGICLGYQILGIASGAKTVKMKFGHHGANHPVKSLADGSVMITSQNHGFAMDEQSLPETFRVTHRSLFDATLQGIERIDCPAFGFQGHPEASPGPHDCQALFNKFIAFMKDSKESQKNSAAS